MGWGGGVSRSMIIEMFGAPALFPWQLIGALWGRRAKEKWGGGGGGGACYLPTRREPITPTDYCQSSQTGQGMPRHGVSDSVPGRSATTGTIARPQQDTALEDSSRLAHLDSCATPLHRNLLSGAWSGQAFGLN